MNFIFSLNCNYDTLSFFKPYQKNWTASAELIPKMIATSNEILAPQN